MEAEDVSAGTLLQPFSSDGPVDELAILSDPIKRYGLDGDRVHDAERAEAYGDGVESIVFLNED